MRRNGRGGQDWVLCCEEGVMIASPSRYVGPKHEDGGYGEEWLVEAME